MPEDNTNLREKLEEAWEAYTNSALEKAEEICHSILVESPNLAEPNYLLGHINLDRKRFTDSLSLFEAALESDTSKRITGIIYYWIGRVYEEGDIFEENKNPHYDLKKAIDNYKLAIENENFPKDALFKLIQKERLDYEKLKLYQIGIRKFPDEPVFYIQSSNYYGKNSNFKLQLEQLQEGIKNCKITDALNYFIGKYFETRREFDKARNFYNEAIKHLSSKSYSATINYLIGNLYYEEENYKSAEEQYKKNLSIVEVQDFDFLFSVIGLLAVLFKQNRLIEVESLIEDLQFDSISLCDIELSYGTMIWFDNSQFDVIHLHENSILTSELLEKVKFKNKKKQFEINLTSLKILLYKNQREYLKRLNSFKSLKSIINKRNFDFFFKDLREAYHDFFQNADQNISINNEVSEFIRDIKEFPQFESEVSDYLDDFIKVFFARNIYSSIKELDSVFNYIQTNKDECLFEIAYSLNESGNTSLAKKYYEKILTNNSKNGAVLNNLGVIYEKEEDYDQAIRFFKNAQKTDREKELYKNNLARCLKLKQDKIEKEKKKKIPEKWTKFNSHINTSNLDDLEYFEIIDRIYRINKKYRLLIERDVNELFFNHILHNDKASIVLSGSLIELLLTYFCDKKKIKIISVKDFSGKVKNKKLYDCVLSELIGFCENQNFFGSDFPHLGNLSRIYRNYIHPGRELKESLNRSKAELCFISTKELLKKILP